HTSSDRDWSSDVCSSDLVRREHASTKGVLAKWDELETARKQLDENRELATSRDVEIAAMADDEIPDLEKRVAELERELQFALLQIGRASCRERVYIAVVA